MTLRLTIPGLPPMNTASGMNRWVRRDERTKWERRVADEVLATLHRRPTPLHLARVTIIRHSAGPEPDGDNLANGAKFLLDGLKKAGVILDDKPAVIGHPILRWEPAPRGTGHVEIIVEPMEPNVEIGPRVPARNWTGDEAA